MNAWYVDGFLISSCFIYGATSTAYSDTLHSMALCYFYILHSNYVDLTQNYFYSSLHWDFDIVQYLCTDWHETSQNFYKTVAEVWRCILGWQRSLVWLISQVWILHRKPKQETLKILYTFINIWLVSQGNKLGILLFENQGFGDFRDA